MKLDTKSLRYLTPEDWRVLTAVEIGSKNHEVVPTPLIAQLSNLRNATGTGNKGSGGRSGGKGSGQGAGGGGGGSGVHKSISTLAKANLIARTKNAKYDGYRLTYGGLDYLALHTHMKHSTIYSVGPCVGSGKESDIYVCADPSGVQQILKIHRLGRISFRSVKNNRDYLRHRSSASWMYMSRLAAQKEFLFMRALGDCGLGFRVPRAIAQNRHMVVMELIEGTPLRSVKRVGDPAGLYAELMDTILRLAQVGLIHGDFNEFNIMLKEEKEENEEEGEEDVVTPIVIDFPQMVSVDHANAEMYFDRDVRCIKDFFERRFHFVSDEPGPFFHDAKIIAAAPAAPGAAANPQSEGPANGENSSKIRRLDIEVEASGFSKKMAKELEKYIQDVINSGGGGSQMEEVGDDDEEGKEEDGDSVSDHSSAESGSRGDQEAD